jgi:predicted MFS family arabinose efflux permease
VSTVGSGDAFLAGFIVKKAGYYRSLLLFSGYVLVATLLFVITGLNGHSKPLLYLVIAVLWTAYSMASVVIYTISMTKVRQGKEGTDYSLQIVITHLSGILVALISGRLADKIGYEDFFFAEAIMATAVFILVYLLFKKERLQQ